MAKKEDVKKAETTKEVEVVVEEKKPKKRRVKVESDLEVKFINFTNGNFVYQHGDTYFDLLEFGDFDYITVGELNKMRNSHRSVLENLWILLVDVEDDEIELDDVLKYLQLDKIYENIMNEEEIDKLLIKDDEVKFKSLFEQTNDKLKDRIIERAVALFRTKEFSNFNKMSVIEQYLKNEQFFNDIQNAEKFLAERNR